MPNLNSHLPAEDIADAIARGVQAGLLSSFAAEATRALDVLDVAVEAVDGRSTQITVHARDSAPRTLLVSVTELAGPPVTYADLKRIAAGPCWPAALTDEDQGRMKLLLIRPGDDDRVHVHQLTCPDVARERVAVNVAREIMHAGSRTEVAAWAWHRELDLGGVTEAEAHAATRFFPCCEGLPATAP